MCEFLRETKILNVVLLQMISSRLNFQFCVWTQSHCLGLQQLFKSSFNWVNAIFIKFFALVTLGIILFHNQFLLATENKFLLLLEFNKPLVLVKMQKVVEIFEVMLTLSAQIRNKLKYMLILKEKDITVSPLLSRKNLVRRARLNLDGKWKQLKKVFYLLFLKS